MNFIAPNSPTQPSPQGSSSFSFSKNFPSFYFKNGRDSPHLSSGPSPSQIRKSTAQSLKSIRTSPSSLLSFTLTHLIGIPKASLVGTLARLWLKEDKPQAGLGSPFKSSIPNCLAAHELFPSTHLLLPLHNTWKDLRRPLQSSCKMFPKKGRG